MRTRKPKAPKVTKNNYFSTEINQYYWSASLVKSFLSCPERAIAELNGTYERPHSDAILLGSYVDAFFDGKKTFERFKAEHPELLSTRGESKGMLKAEYRQADKMLERATSEPVFMEYMKGQKQKILTGKIGGVPFKAKLDVYLKGQRIVDLKTVKDFNSMYKPGEGKLTFADYWNWPLQMAIYQELVRQNTGDKLPCYLACITKENPPDVEVIQIPQEKLDAELNFLLEKLPYFDAMKQGIVDPERCESCAYCRGTKKLTGPKSLDWFDEFSTSSEE